MKICNYKIRQPCLINGYIPYIITDQGDIGVRVADPDITQSGAMSF